MTAALCELIAAGTEALPQLTLARVKRLLAARQPRVVPLAGRTSSAVALILREQAPGLEVLLIVRAEVAADPWSGNIGFPGGRVDTGDGSPRMTAERESLEELSLDLRQGEYLGRLDDIVGAHLPVQVACFVFAVTNPPQFCLNREVARAFWLPLADLLEPNRHREIEVEFGGERFHRPAIELPEAGGPVLWGITYRLLSQFLDALGYSLAKDPMGSS